MFYLVAQGELIAVGVHYDGPAVLQLPEQHGVDGRLLDLLMDQAGHQTRAVGGVVTVLREPRAARLVELERHALLRELRAELADELVDDLLDRLEGERLERNPRVEAIAELGRERPIASGAGAGRGVGGGVRDKSAR